MRKKSSLFYCAEADPRVDGNRLQFARNFHRLLRRADHHFFNNSHVFVVLNFHSEECSIFIGIDRWTLLVVNIISYTIVVIIS